MVGGFLLLRVPFYKTWNLAFFNDNFEVKNGCAQHVKKTLKLLANTVDPNFTALLLLLGTARDI